LASKFGENALLKETYIVAGAIALAFLLELAALAGLGVVVILAPPSGLSCALRSTRARRNSGCNGT
jgi:hypothetical protein